MCTVWLQKYEPFIGVKKIAVISKKFSNAFDYISVIYGDQLPK
jgi:hypothetical protein